MTDMFFVIEGVLTFKLGDETVEGPAGSFVLVPPGNVHTFSNPSSAPARFLSLCAPAGFEQYFKELSAALAGGEIDPAMVARLYDNYDVEPV
jgi:mannose-6-phosphate isomerase-like protein (cupin superfamily)